MKTGQGEGGRPTEVFILIVHDESRKYFVELGGGAIIC